LFFIALSFSKLVPFILHFSEWPVDLQKTRNNIHEYYKKVLTDKNFSESQIERLVIVTDEGKNVDALTEQGFFLK